MAELVDLSLDAPRIVVYADGQELESSYVRRIERSGGGALADRAEIEISREKCVLDISVLIGVQDILIMRETHTTGGVSRQALFWGHTSAALISIGAEVISIEARIGRYLFGDSIQGMRELDTRGSGGTIRTLEEDLVFNPTIDGRTRGNMYRYEQGPGQENLFVDFDSIRTAPARFFKRLEFVLDDDYKANEHKLLWPISEAVLYLCWTLNPDETWIRNPIRATLESVFGADVRVLRGVRILIGTRLPQALDILLEPLGYSWFVQPGEVNRDLVFYGRGKGPEKSIRLDRPESREVDYEQELKIATISAGLQSLVNEVTVVGALKELETTIELFPAWPATLDTLTEDVLAKDSEDYIRSTSNRRVRREYVANEAGDYTGTRPEHTKPLDLSRIFGESLVARRRRPLPTIALDNDNNPAGSNGYVIEYTFEPGGTAVWLPIAELEVGDVQILHDEIGIRFDGQLPPIEAFDPAFRVRITCTLRDDRRIRSTSLRDANSPQSYRVAETVVEEGYRERYVDATSKFYVPVQNRVRKADEIDDAQAIADYAATLRRTHDAADVRARLQLALVDGPQQFEIGDVITKILGREIDLAARISGENRYPQVTAIVYDFDNQQRELALERLRDAAP